MPLPVNIVKVKYYKTHNLIKEKRVYHQVEMEVAEIILNLEDQPLYAYIDGTQGTLFYDEKMNRMCEKELKKII